MPTSPSSPAFLAPVEARPLTALFTPSPAAVSRRVVAQTQAQLDAWRATPLDALDLVGLLIDGVHVGGHCIVVALGVEVKHVVHQAALCSRDDGG